MGIHWLVSGVLVAGLTWFTYNMQQKDHEASSMESGLYTGFSRLLWSILIWMVTYACITGHGGPVNEFLSLPFWQPLARLTYAIYIIHMPIMMLSTGSSKRPIYFSFRNMVCVYFRKKAFVSKSWTCISYLLFQFLKFCGDLVVAILLSVVLTLGIESPVIVLEKLMFTPRKKLNIEEPPTNVTSRPLGFETIQAEQPTAPVP